MVGLTANQLKVLSDFLNTIAAAWFTAGAISPLFIKSENIFRTILLGLIAVSLSLGLLSLSLSVARRIKK